MPQQYVATDNETGVEVSVTGEFPPDPEDRIRIARTSTLFTRLMATLLRKPESERRTGFRAVETQLELADALIRQDVQEVQRLLRDTMATMGVTQEQLEDLARQLHQLGSLDEATVDELRRALGLPPEAVGDSPASDSFASDSPADGAEPGADDGSGHGEADPPADPTDDPAAPFR